MVEVGASLKPSETLESMVRAAGFRSNKHMREHVCVECGGFPYPRGFSEASGLCWWCAFPRDIA